MRTTKDYRPGALNVQVNGIQIEDLYIQHQAYKRKSDELEKLNANLSNQLREQGFLIKNLKDELARLKELQDTSPMDKLKYEVKFGNKCE